MMLVLPLLQRVLDALNTVRFLTGVDIESDEDEWGAPRSRGASTSLENNKDGITWHEVGIV